ncbi:Acetyl-/propionyl-coenzyme A carboxylase alpha chain (Includes: Biotin carboxylase; Biotin carboxyl carrier protein) [Candidatus Terasakiella magnetica]|uniref:Acetyl-/propionyl-coenzyme A carboxylase alpha chain n=1 Tax=Candidatus Terasakiella magnetica TaxID=1867952 RepID=A0A1C3RD97_9PROT|nr:acetyl/propionyl/methylcrotonyl-CoA carboxylase subunit alpha [Candidatus Terasakiella magnetica]SCA55239.1 Acetyl-/propionyl-coenzyme A carboxylase alpha chain (Includes: Biotin carboxylase; Biotin carboxyl carrier protein) [Candidatus Terasakiella magnetica]
MFTKILIANRGEIACRVIKTARRMGVKTVAVYSDADAGAMHVAMADEAYHIGGSAAADSYLVYEKIIDVCKKSGAQAVHPGYGFLSENAAFCKALAENDITFIGPPVGAIEAMGSKSEAKKIMEQADVPLVPGYHGEEQSVELMREHANKMGYPVILKAAAGGGGKGMRIVWKESEIEDAWDSARREAMKGFGDDHMLVEKYLTKPRHVEIQVFADSHDECVYLFERDCSVQRRHQKVVEEAPAPNMTQDLRHKMGVAACNAARAIGYVGAGTVEFLLDEDGSFYFMEMNTRLQVEHPVTEMITGEDLVEWQLRVAAGQAIPVKQDDLSMSGHSMEVRIYAEDPNNDFLPATGELKHLRTPKESAHVRIDTGVREGDEVSIYYDPMISKLIVWADTREGALRHMRKALADYQVVGLTTNIEFLATLVSHPAFVNFDVDTGFIERHENDLFPARDHITDDALALACLDVFITRDEEAQAQADWSGDPFSPWHSTSGFRMNDDNHHELYFGEGDDIITVTCHYRDDGFLMELPGGDVHVRGERDANGDLMADLGGRRMKATVVRHGDNLEILVHGLAHALKLFDPMAASENMDEVSGSLTSPMPGKVVSVLVEKGQEVSEGDSLMILEAMKMEHTIFAPMEGVVEDIFFNAGDQLEEGVELLKIHTE